MISPTRACAWLLTVTLGVCAAPAAHAGETVRWLLAIGSNDGGSGRVLLKHAGTDAESVKRVLEDLGGLDPSRAIVVSDPTSANVATAFTGLGTMLSLAHAQGRRSEVIVYYSGHADERGLRPHGDLIAWADLRRMIGDLDAEVKIAVVDACESGALLRGKGGVHQPGFLRDESNLVRGEAYLVSSSADEASQESDRLAASFFTYHLVAALRGAADADRDRRVTLEEAYDYAYAETVRGTEASWVGAQHPNYDIALQGRGDVVLTDLRARDSVIRFDEALDGLVSIRDAKGALVAEVRKTVGTPMSYTVPAGHYVVRLRARAAQYRAEVDVTAAAPANLSAAELKDEGPLALNRLRGAFQPRPRKQASASTRTVPFVFELAPRLGTAGFASHVGVRGFALDVLGSEVDSVTGGSLGAVSVLHGDLKGASVEALASVVGGEVHGLQLGTVNAAGSVDGAQLGVVNFAGDHAFGAQIGAANWVRGRQRGIQWAGLFNVVEGRSADGQLGSQLATFYNRAAQGQKGVQFALVNSSDRLTGWQWGLVNVGGTVRGLQLGLVNIAARVDHGEAIGLLNVIGNGYHTFEVWTDDVSPLAIGFKTGGEHIYSLFTFGFDPSGDQSHFTYGVGLGGHIPIKRFSMDIDLLASALEGDAKQIFTALPHGVSVRPRLSLGIDLSPNLTLFGGAEAAVSLRWDRGADGAPASESFVPSTVVPSAVGLIRVGAGYLAGLRVRF
jgi:hypothetical protein